MLIINPSSDQGFVRLVKEQAPSAGTPAALQLALREEHPRATVRARELSGELMLVWYVYRDGSWASDARRVAEGS